MSEQKFEECSLQNATHIEMGGKVYEIGQDEFTSKHQVIKYNDYNIEVHKGTYSGNIIHVNAFPLLGIKPMREIKPEPIEFEATFIKHDGKWHTLAILNDNFAYLNNKRVRFHCVEILEEME